MLVLSIALHEREEGRQLRTQKKNGLVLVALTRR